MLLEIPIQIKISRKDWWRFKTMKFDKDGTFVSPVTKSSYHLLDEETSTLKKLVSLGLAKIENDNSWEISKGVPAHNYILTSIGRYIHNKYSL